MHFLLSVFNKATGLHAFKFKGQKHYFQFTALVYYLISLNREQYTRFCSVPKG